MLVRVACTVSYAKQSRKVFFAVSLDTLEHRRWLETESITNFMTSLSDRKSCFATSLYLLDLHYKE